jgi:hypothetical protein
MKKSGLWFVFVALFVCFFTPSKAAAQFNQSQTIVCESRHNGVQYCPMADSRNEVVMAQQLGDERCVRGETWGVDGGGIWVARGCRARFQINPRRVEGPVWWIGVPGRRPRNLPRSGACFFKNKNFSGDYFCSDRGSDIPLVQLNDEITSIQIYGRARVTIFSDPNFGGRQGTTNRSISDLRQWRLPDDPSRSWNNRLSSARVD